MQEKVTETRSKTRLTESENTTESPLKTQDMVLILKSKNKYKRTLTTEKKAHSSSSLTTLKYRIFTKKAISQNQICRQPGNFPPKHKMQPDNHYCIS